jgi:hypothetical protein
MRGGKNQTPPEQKKYIHSSSRTFQSMVSYSVLANKFKEFNGLIVFHPVEIGAVERFNSNF